MQINIEHTAKTRKGGFFRSLIASTIRMDPISSGLSFAGGGVCGRVKLNKPNARLEIAPNQKMFKEADHPTKPNASPATIHPIVPQTRTFGNST